MAMSFRPCIRVASMASLEKADTAMGTSCRLCALLVAVTMISSKYTSSSAFPAGASQAAPDSVESAANIEIVRFMDLLSYLP